MENDEKFGKKLLLLNYVPFSLIYLTGQIMTGGGNFASVFRPKNQSFALKSCPGAAILRGKISSPGFSLRGGEWLPVILTLGSLTSTQM